MFKLQYLNKKWWRTINVRIFGKKLQLFY